MDLRSALTVLLLSLTLLSSGCTTAPIPKHFEPLETLVERPFGDNSFITTFHTSAWVNNIDDFHQRKPVGSPQYNATMIHERIHSIRMGNFFTSCWFGLVYLFSTDSMWEEEQIGWYYQLKYMQRKGILKPAEHTALVLARYSNITGKMVSYDEALKWVRDVLAGRWEPDLTPEERSAYEAPAETN